MNKKQPEHRGRERITALLKGTALGLLIGAVAPGAGASAPDPSALLQSPAPPAARLPAFPETELADLRDAPSVLEATPSTESVQTPIPQQLATGYGRIPMHFEPNLGQTDAAVRYLARGPGYTLFLTDAEAVLVLRKGREPGAEAAVGEATEPAEPDIRPRGRATAPGAAQRAEEPAEVAVVRMHLEGERRNASPRIEGAERRSGVSNYFRGKDPAAWRTGVPHYARVRYEAVYPGIDLVFYGNPHQLEYDFVVAPGADPAQIRLSFAGAEGVRLDETGNLVLAVPGGELVQRAPVIYQEIDGERRAVAGGYRLLAEANRVEVASGVDDEQPTSTGVAVGFQLAAYNADRPLVIDPVIAYSTYLGGGGEDYGSAIAVDAAGNAYVTGQTGSYDFPTVNALDPSFNGGGYYGQDAFVAKLSADGQRLLYATYLGGSAHEDRGTSIAVDAAGNAYVTGTTRSNDFPTVNALDPSYNGGSYAGDAFVAKLSADGRRLVYSTYLGGTGDDFEPMIAVDAAGSAYVTGSTDSNDFPTVNALQPSLNGWGDVFVAKLSPDGRRLVYATYLGGTDSAYGSDRGTSIAVDAAGHAYVTGQTGSDDFPTVNALYPSRAGSADTFIAKLSADGQRLVYATYLGGTGADWGSAIAVDAAGQAHVTGYTCCSADFPTVNAFDSSYNGITDAFIAKLSADGQRLLYATYLGGSDYDVGQAIAVDAAGHAYVTGLTGSADFPTVDALDASLGGRYDAFIATLSADGRRLDFATYLGGSASAASLGGSTDDSGYSIALDAAGNAYVTGYTDTTDFPTVNALYPSHYGIESQAFITKLSPTDTAVDFGLDVLDARDFRDGPTVSRDAALLASRLLGGPRIGVATDGAARLLLRARTDRPGTVTFSIADPAGGATGNPFEDGQLESPLDGSSQPTLAQPAQPVSAGDADHHAFALYHAPSVFPRAGFAEDLTAARRLLRLRVTFAPSDGSGVQVSERDLVLSRPPVVLIHGLNSSSATWATLQDKLRERIPDLYVDADVGQYPYGNKASFATNALVPIRAASLARGHFIDQGLATVEVDLLGHSMGGILGRIAASLPDYRGDFNYGHGYFNKLIAIDSPHHGSPWADLVWQGLNLPFYRPTVAFTLGIDPGVLLGAYEDLQTDSPALCDMREQTTDVPAHVVVGNYTPTVDDLADLTCLATTFVTEPLLRGACNAWRTLKYAGFDTGVSTNFPLGGDLVVGVESQQGGFYPTDSQVSEMNHIHWDFGDYPAALDTDATADLVVSLLNAAPADPAWFDAFPAAPCEATPRQLASRMPAPMQPAAAGELVIISPADGAIVEAGQTLTVTVQSDPAVILSSVLVASPGDVLERTAPPWTFDIAVPEEAIGPFGIAAVGKDSAGGLYDADILLNVVAPDALVSLSPAPANLVITDADFPVAIAVTGTYEDGTQRDLSGAATGTTYTSADAAVAAVDASGRITAVGNGATTIDVANGARAATVVVVVELPTDLAVTQTPITAAVPPDSAVTYRLDVFNLGSDSAREVWVEDRLPAGSTFIGAIGAGWSCLDANGVVSCYRPTLAAGASAPLAIETLAPSLEGPASNRVAVRHGGDDADAVNNVAVQSLDIRAPAAPGAGELAVAFGGNGLWHDAGGVWKRLTTWTAGTAGLAGWSGGLAADFDSKGVWIHDGTGWSKRSGWDPGDAMSGWSGGVAVDFDGLGLWSYDGTRWRKLSSWNAEALAGWSEGLAADFGSNGLWSYDGAAWRKLSSWNPGDGGLGGWSGGLGVDFDGNGTWNHDGTGWRKLSSWNPGAGGFGGWSGGLAVDFDGNGTWNHDGTGWRKLSGWNPGEGGLASFGECLAVDYDVSGLWIYDGSRWSKRSGLDAEALDAVDLN